MGVSVESGVITTSSSSRALYLPRHPPIPRLPSVSISPLFRTTIVLDEIPIPAWPLHCSKVFKLFHQSSFTEKGCIFPTPPDYYPLVDRVYSSDITLTLLEYFHFFLNTAVSLSVPLIKNAVTIVVFHYI
jgi:hypothetical protein